MTETQGRRRRAALALLGVAIALAGCGPGPASPTMSPATTQPTTSVPSTSSSTGPDRPPGLPAAFDQVATIRGAAVGSPRVVRLPDGSFLMLMSQDIPGGRSLLRSTDGRTWDTLDARATGIDAGSIVDVAASDTTVVVLGTLAPLDGSSGVAPVWAEWASADGVSWSRVPDGGAFESLGVQAIFGSPNGFALLGDARTTILLSGPDGRTWRRTELPVAPGARAGVDQVAPAGDGLLALGTVEGRNVVWRWSGAGWLALRLPATDAMSRVVTSGGRIVVTGTSEIPDPARPDVSTLIAIAWESTDDGVTWGKAGLPLEGIEDVYLFALDRGFLAVLAPLASDEPLSAWRSTVPGIWEPVSLSGAGRRDERPLVSSLAVSGRRVLLAGNTVGTGAGGDRVVVWIGETTLP